MELEPEIARVKDELAKLPEGKLVCCADKWYVSDGHTKKYIPKTNRKYAKELAHRRYLECFLDEKLVEYNASVRYLNACSHIKYASDLLINNNELRNLISDLYMPLSEELNLWMQAEYETNPYHIENLIHKSCSGKLLRSKSESIIDMCLFNSRIPYRYECKLVLGKKVLYPDFTTRHPRTGRLLYWEHFGRMDDPEYAQKACDKIKLYVSCGIIPSVDLITTYETKDNPLTIDKVMRIIDEYFM